MRNLRKLIYATPSSAQVRGEFIAATAGGPPSATEGGSAANGPGGRSRHFAKGKRAVKSSTLNHAGAPQLGPARGH